MIAIHLNQSPIRNRFPFTIVSKGTEEVKHKLQCACPVPPILGFQKWRSQASLFMIAALKAIDFSGHLLIFQEILERSAVYQHMQFHVVKWDLQQ